MSFSFDNAGTRIKRKTTKITDDLGGTRMQVTRLTSSADKRRAFGQKSSSFASLDELKSQEELGK